ncbi:polyphosphate:AMP phosphotransferase [Thiorhodovibrio frisius]|uniref:Polyphosphate:AMP phosphotransferase n=1 Tax=Thiorhodovibrio frisius TaxID=631362 RepID=H8Z4G5_9GAMM|nr:polyphosphate:AMP phosphotransferase [Thiorhodovibrio frisius]EIC20222.1 polyphosphate:AMP phosphotransferase [Thiorhodovibrio frisius]WPL20960.1 polyphosphate:AMP phosphotransferase [Thiorhodovibrio frisius]
MFEATKVGRSVSKSEFKEQRDELRTQLLEVQRQLRETHIPVIVVVAGVEAAGKGEVVNRLNEWLDTRGLQTFAYWDLSDEERERPRYWRFWRNLPPRGEIALLFGGWYLTPIEHRFRGLCDDAALDAELTRIVDFERMLTQDGALVVKFWFHLNEKDQKQRLKELSRDDRSRWKMLPEKSKFSEQYELFEHVAERVIRQTDRGIAPWYLVEATDSRYRDLTVGKTLLQAIRARISQPLPMEPPPTADPLDLPDSAPAQITLLDQLDLTQKLERDLYKSELKRLQAEINELTWTAYKKQRTTVLVFEGMDAGGKGGAIRRITSAVDARLYRAIPVAAPSDEEKAHHYLWRFWRHIPRAGYMIIYDRSWYGRVLVERVEGFASEAEWRRAYSEINDFEEQLVEQGAILLKFWLQVSDDEQLERFRDREKTPYKQYKITDEDWRNREKAPQYKAAVNEMVARTSTEYAPWTLVEGDDKPFARIRVLSTICEQLRAALAEDVGASVRSVKRCGDHPERRAKPEARD